MQYKCCGVGNFSDWVNKGPYGKDPVADKYVPDSCCEGQEDVEKCTKDKDGPKIPGCFEKFKDAIEDNSRNILAVGVTVVVVMVRK